MSHDSNSEERLVEKWHRTESSGMALPYYSIPPHFPNALK